MLPHPQTLSRSVKAHSGLLTPQALAHRNSNIGGAGEGRLMAATGIMRGVGCEEGGQWGRLSEEGAGARELRLTLEEDGGDMV